MNELIDYLVLLSTINSYPGTKYINLTSISISLSLENFFQYNFTFSWYNMYFKHIFL